LDLSSHSNPTRRGKTPKHTDSRDDTSGTLRRNHQSVQTREPMSTSVTSTNYSTMSTNKNRSPLRDRSDREVVPPNCFLGDSALRDDAAHRPCAALTKIAGAIWWR